MCARCSQLKSINDDSFIFLNYVRFDSNANKQNLGTRIDCENCRNIKYEIFHYVCDDYCTISFSSTNNWALKSIESEKKPSKILIMAMKQWKSSKSLKCAPASKRRAARNRNHFHYFGPKHRLWVCNNENLFIVEPSQEQQHEEKNCQNLDINITVYAFAVRTLSKYIKCCLSQVP